MSELQKKIKEKELKLIKEFLHSVTFGAFALLPIYGAKKLSTETETKI